MEGFKSTEQPLEWCENCKLIKLENHVCADTVPQMSINTMTIKDQKSKIPEKQKKTQMMSQFKDIIPKYAKQGIDTKQKANTTSDDETDKLDIPRRKYRERYFILKEIR